MAKESSRLVRAASLVSLGLQLIVFAGWIITALCVTALNIANKNRRFTGALASASLLTYLVAHVIVALTPPVSAPSKTDRKKAKSHHGEPMIAHFLVSAGAASRTGSFVLFLFSCAWLYDLIVYGLLLGFLTVFGGITCLSIYYSDSMPDNLRAVARNVLDANSANRTSSSSLRDDSIIEFHRRTGINLLKVVNGRSIWLLVSFVVIVWANFVTLCLFVLRSAWRSLWAVLTSSAHGLVREEKVVVTRADGKKEMVAVQSHLVIDGWHKI